MLTRLARSRRGSIRTIPRAAIRREHKYNSTLLPPLPIDERFLDSVSYYWDTTPPAQANIERAAVYFKSATPKLLYSSTTFRDIQRSELSEVAFFGRSNVGKSSLLNALMGRSLCHTSKKPGRTRSINYFSIIGKNGTALGVLDMPGYGKGSHAEWGTEIMKYIAGRRQLRRAFLLVDPLHGLKSTDEQILSLFRNQGIPHQVILNKVDRVLFPKLRTRTAANVEKKAVQNAPTLKAFVEGLRSKIQPGLDDGPEALGEVVTCSAETHVGNDKYGINAVRWAVLAAVNLGQEKRRTDTLRLPAVDEDIAVKDAHSFL